MCPFELSAIALEVVRGYIANADRYYRNEFGCYTCTYEHPLTDEEKKELDEGVARMEQARKKVGPVR